jgi:hypothetical protein
MQIIFFKEIHYQFCSTNAIAPPPFVKYIYRLSFSIHGFFLPPDWVSTTLERFESANLTYFSFKSLYGTET